MKWAVFTGILLAMASCSEAPKKTKESMEETARRIHEKVITIDTHDDINVDNFTDSINYTSDIDTQVNLPLMEAGGLDVAWFIVYTGQDSLDVGGYEKASRNAMAKFDAIHRLCEQWAPERIALALTSADVRRIHTSRRRVAMIGVENAYPLGVDLSQLARYHELGARYMSLAHNGHSQFSDSHTGEKDGIWLYNGLSELGKEAVNELNKLGIMIDVSHTSREAMIQTVALSRAPVIASHSSARALCDHSRNLDDEQLMLLRDNGGVVQAVAFPAYLDTAKSTARAEFMSTVYRAVADSLNVPWYDMKDVPSLAGQPQSEYIRNLPKVKRIAEKKARGMADALPAVNVADFVNHIDYMVHLIGIDHVGISSDFDGGGGIEGWSDASETFNVTLELVRRGYGEEEIAKLWGENLLHVLDEVQRVAKSLAGKQQ